MVLPTTWPPTFYLGSSHKKVCLSNSLFSVSAVFFAITTMLILRWWTWFYVLAAYDHYVSPFYKCSSEDPSDQVTLCPAKHFLHTERTSCTWYQQPSPCVSVCRHYQQTWHLHVHTTVWCSSTNNTIKSPPHVIIAMPFQNLISIAVKWKSCNSI